jgi:ATP-binding protein involved in chromosome partitioning
MVTSNLAVALARLGKRVGLLDADVYGFSIPRMLGLTGQPTVIDDKIVPLRRGDNLQVVSMGFFVDEDEPVIWRGPLLHKAINQFINDVTWDKLDYLLLDLPPGTGDVTLTRTLPAESPSWPSEPT